MIQLGRHAIEWMLVILKSCCKIIGFWIFFVCTHFLKKDEEIFLNVGLLLLKTITVNLKAEMGEFYRYFDFPSTLSEMA